MSGAHPSCLTDGSIDSEGPSRWRERALDLCFQSLRRHEHFLDTTYFALLPFKLLCCLIALRTRMQQTYVIVIGNVSCCLESKLPESIARISHDQSVSVPNHIKPDHNEPCSWYIVFYVFSFGDFRGKDLVDSSGLQVNLGTFDTRKLEEFLNPMLLAFVDRLNLGRSLAFCSSSSVLVTYRSYFKKICYPVYIAWSQWLMKRYVI